MGSLTLNIDEDLLRRARIRALEQGTSVNTLVREWLERYTGEVRDPSEEIIELLNASAANRDSDAWRWNRADIYEDRLSRYDR